MADTLKIVLDVSGSFAENGKIEILRAMKLSAESFAEKFGAPAEFFIWRDEIRPLNKPADLVPSGRAEISALCTFLEKNSGAKFVLLSDGAWTLRNVTEIRRAIKSSKAALVFVAVGADAADSENYSVSTVGGIWSAADLGSAIQAVCAS